jgi:hypothetical protein
LNLRIALAAAARSAQQHAIEPVGDATVARNGVGKIFDLECSFETT